MTWFDKWETGAKQKPLIVIVRFEPPTFRLEEYVDIFLQDLQSIDHINSNIFCYPHLSIAHDWITWYDL